MPLSSDPKINKSYLQWQCRRGMKEIEVLLMPFVETHYDALNEAEKHVFLQFLEEADAEIHSWFLGYETPKNIDYQVLIEKIKTVHLIGDQ
ncbi:MAG: succinate dehydrogenase assembly factor 2 [Pseudomonadota bacterium]